MANYGVSEETWFEFSEETWHPKNESRKTNYFIKLGRKETLYFRQRVISLIERLPVVKIE